MEYAAFIFGIFGLMAYMQVSSLKVRIDEMERQLTQMKGTSYHEDRTALLQAAKTYMNKAVNIDLKEDHGDIDIMNYGNSKHGTNTILDADNEWLLVRIETPKAVKTKLLRMESIERIRVIKE